MTDDEIRLKHMLDIVRFVTDTLNKPREVPIPKAEEPAERAILKTELVLADSVQAIVVRAIANYQRHIQVCVNQWLEINETSKVHQVPQESIDRARLTDDMCEAILIGLARMPMDSVASFFVRIEAPNQRGWDRDKCRAHIDDLLDEVMTKNHINNYTFLGNPHHA